MQYTIESIDMLTVCAYYVSLFVNTRPHKQFNIMSCTCTSEINKIDSVGLSVAYRKSGYAIIR